MTIAFNVNMEGNLFYLGQFSKHLSFLISLIYKKQRKLQHFYGSYFQWLVIRKEEVSNSIT